MICKYQYVYIYIYVLLIFGRVGLERLGKYILCFGCGSIVTPMEPGRKNIADKSHEPIRSQAVRWSGGQASASQGVCLAPSF